MARDPDESVRLVAIRVAGRIGAPGARGVVSPFLPHPPVVAASLRCLGLPVTEADGRTLAIAHAEEGLA